MPGARGEAASARPSGAPAAASIAAAPSMPGRSSTGCAPEQSTIADSMPTRHAPPSRTSRSAPNSRSTCAAVVGLTRPKRFALGAATPGTPRPAAAPQECVRDRMRRAAQAERRLAGGGRVGHARPARDDHRQRPGPERVDEALGQRRQRLDEGRKRGALGDVDDQRMGRRPALQRKHPRHGRVVVGARAQAVNGLGRRRRPARRPRAPSAACSTAAASRPSRITAPARRRCRAARRRARALASASPAVAAVKVACPILRPRRASALP